MAEELQRAEKNGAAGLSGKRSAQGPLKQYPERRSRIFTRPVMLQIWITGAISVFPANIPLPGVCSQICTAAGSGRCDSFPVSVMPPILTGVTAICWRRGRRG